ncbi:MAG: class I SAM-dependent methyltransferase [Nitrospiraceae bacterium]|nr:class I SAM-dependent methyltransferase [Nitrospiraceae bacterium]
MDQQKMKAVLKETFDTVSGGYDGDALRFFPRSAENMAALLGVKGDEHVLDVACGTGHASMAVARKLQKGKVTAVDFSAGMLVQARRKAESRGIGNIDFLEGDMQELPFEEGRFDAAVCAFGIFFVMDMETQLAHIASRVKPGGKVMISNFQESYFHPLKDLFVDRLTAYGVTNPPQAWKRIAHEDGCRQLFETAGMKDISVEKRNVGYHLAGAQEWWDIVWNAGFRRLVAQLSAEDQERFKREHLAEVDALKSKDGIWLDVGVLYTVGTTGR